MEIVQRVKKLNSISRAQSNFRRRPFLCTTLYRNPMQASNFGGTFDHLFLWICLWNFHRRCVSTSSIPWCKKVKNDQKLKSRAGSCLKCWCLAVFTAVVALFRAARYIFQCSDEPDNCARLNSRFLARTRRRVSLLNQGGEIALMHVASWSESYTLRNSLMGVRGFRPVFSSVSFCSQTTCSVRLGKAKPGNALLLTTEDDLRGASLRGRDPGA